MRMAPSPLRTVGLLIGLRLRRLLNMLGRGLAFQRTNANTGSTARTATLGKRRFRTLLSVLVMVPMLLSFGSIARSSVLNLTCQLGTATNCGSDSAMQVAVLQLHSAPWTAPLLAALTFQLALLWLVSLLLPLSTGELSRPDWDMEWLVTLPTSTGTLLWARVLERSVANPAGLIALLPTTVIIAWYSGLGWFSPLPALLACLPLLLLAAMLRTLVDTGLCLALSPARLGNLQAMISLLALLPMYLGMSFGMGTNGFAFGWAAAMPAWLSWTPPGLVIRCLNAPDALTALSAAALLLAQSAVAMALGMAVLRRQLRHGVAGAGESAQTRTASGKAVQAPVPAGRWNVGTAIQRRELTLLLRDRNFLVQTMLLPVLILGGQALVTGQLNDLQGMLDSPALLASTGFFLGTYTLMMSAFQNLNKEGGALWLLYTFPLGVEQALRQKAQLWAVLAMLYPLILFGAVLAVQPAWDWHLAGLMLLALLGIALYCVIAVALGVFASDPLATEAAAKLRPAYLYLYMLLTGLYIAALSAGSLVQQLVFVVLTGALAVALWQKARDEIPYLLDPAASPPARVSAADGLIATMLFFVLQVLALLVLKDKGEASLPDITLAFGIAGAATYVLTRLVYWRSKASGMPRIGHGRKLWRHGLSGAAVAAACGIAYTALLKHSGQLLPPAFALAQDWHWLWLIGLTVLAAPLCEEFIFRGLLQGGLRRSLPAWQAIVFSAALFAIVHPSLSMLPVLLLGLCAGWAYERSGTLAAPMLVHAGYNAAILACQFAMA